MTASTEITSRIETITPDMAECMLGANNQNRSIARRKGRSSHIREALAEAMSARSGDEGIRRLAEGLRSTLDMACIRNEGAQA